MEILERLKDLYKQATIERSHYYVATTAREAIDIIEQLRQAIVDIDMALAEDDLDAASEIVCEAMCL